MKIFSFDMNLAFLRSVFSEPDGTGSTTRILMTAIVAFVLGAGTSLVYRIHQPVTVTDFVTFLGAGGAFITTTVAPLYLINKGTDAYKYKSGPGGQ